MFINNWYAACIGSELTQAPHKVRMLPCPGHRREPGQWEHKLVPIKGTTRDMARVA